MKILTCFELNAFFFYFKRTLEPAPAQKFSSLKNTPGWWVWSDSHYHYRTQRPASQTGNCFLTQCHGYKNMLTSDWLPCDVTLVKGEFLPLIRRNLDDRNHLETKNFEFFLWSMSTWRARGLWAVLQPATRGPMRCFFFSCGKRSCQPSL